MIRYFKRISTLVTIVVAGFAIVSCEKVNDYSVGDHLYYMKVKASKSDILSKQLEPSGSNLIATWRTSDNIYVRKENVWSTDTLHPTVSDRTSPLAGIIRGFPVYVDDLLHLQFPKKIISYSGQKGTLNDIAENYDYAKADFRVLHLEHINDSLNSVMGSFISSFSNQQAIVKFTLKKSDQTALPSNPTEFTISGGGTTVTLTNIPSATYDNPQNGDGVLWVAVPQMEGIISLSATVGNDTYTYTTNSTKSFLKGYYYSITVGMVLTP